MTFVDSAVYATYLTSAWLFHGRADDGHFSRQQCSARELSGWVGSAGKIEKCVFQTCFSIEKCAPLPGEGQKRKMQKPAWLPDGSGHSAKPKGFVGKGGAAE